ncbi:MAG: BatA domain-containing protein, partial [Pseudomonadota bacterium]
MTVLGPIGFAAPWLLLALIALPILWLILRAVPPAPIRERFPGVALLLGLTDDEAVSDRTPWWLLLLRMLAVAAMIVGLAGPVLNPDDDGQAGNGPLLIVMDGSWAGAGQWPRQIQALDTELRRAGAAGREVAFLHLSDPAPAVFQAANALTARLPGLAPSAWQPAAADAIAAQLPEGSFETVWFSDALEYESRAPLLELLEARGPVRVTQTALDVLALTPAAYVDGVVELTAIRAQPGDERGTTLLAQGRDPAGNATTLATANAVFEDGATTAQTALSLPAELRARVTRFEVQGARSAGAVTLVDDSLRRREVALIAGREGREGLELLSPLHYLQRALAPTADLLNGSLRDVLPANPDVIVLADVATLSDGEAEDLTAWLDEGGLLLRFA